jgi:hypothetical protein
LLPYLQPVAYYHTMSGAFRRGFAAASVALGVFLVGFELNKAGGDLAQASWFWMAVGAGMVVLGVMELFGGEHGPRPPLGE